MKERDKNILVELRFGLTPSSHIDSRFFTDSKENSAKITKIKEDFTAFRNKINSNVIENVADIIRLKKNLLSETKLAKADVSRRYLRKILENLSVYFAKNNLDGISKNQRSKILIQHIREWSARAELRAIETVMAAQVRDRRNRVMRRLINNGWVASLDLRSDFHPVFGDKAFYLTPKGGDFVVEMLGGMVSREIIRAYRFDSDHAHHEMVVSQSILSSLRNSKKWQYNFVGYLDEAGLRRFYRDTYGKYPSTIPDLLIRFHYGKGEAAFYLEVDCGTQPKRVIIERAKKYSPLIIICANDLIARRRQSELKNNLRQGQWKDYLITTFTRFLRDGPFGAGYLSYDRSEYCCCSKLVSCQDSQIRSCCDQHSCPCIKAFFALIEKATETKNSGKVVDEGNQESHRVIPSDNAPDDVEKIYIVSKPSEAGNIKAPWRDKVANATCITIMIASIILFTIMAADIIKTIVAPS